MSRNVVARLAALVTAALPLRRDRGAVLSHPRPGSRGHSDGRSSSLEVVDACLARIDAGQPGLNAVVLLTDDARDHARRADAELANGMLRGPLHGIPFTIKDSFDTAGRRHDGRNRRLAGRVPTRDATVVARLKAAGGILLGKTNTPEFTWSDETDNDVYGRTSNPYDLDRTPGGSSGGAAAIVAAGGSPFDVGSDTGDSIRQPAHVCGIAGLKPTSGRVPRTGHWPGYRGPVRVVHPARADGSPRRGPRNCSCRYWRGRTGRTPHRAGRPRRPAPVSVAGLRVVAFTDNGIRTPTAETILAVEAAARGARAAGRGSETRSRRTSTRRGRLGRPDPGRRVRLASTAHRGAGTPGWGSYATRGWITPGEPLPGDELTALIERADAVRARLLQLDRRRGPRSSVRPCHNRRSTTGRARRRGSATPTATSTTSPAGRRSSCAAGHRPKVCRSASSSSRRPGARTWRWRRAHRRGGLRWLAATRPLTLVNAWVDRLGAGRRRSFGAKLVAPIICRSSERSVRCQLVRYQICLPER